MADNGWGLKNGGVTTNLSGKAGELGEAEKLVKQICMEVEGLKETSRINKELKKDIEDATEVVLPSENVPDRSAISRKRRLVQKLNGELKAVYDVKEDDTNEETDGSNPSASTTSASISTRTSTLTKSSTSSSRSSSSFDVKNNEVNNWLLGFMNQTNSSFGTTTEKKIATNSLSLTLEKMEKHMNEIGLVNLMVNWGLKNTESNIALFEDVGIPIILENFSPEDRDIYVTHLTRCGIDYLAAIKVYKALTALFKTFSD